jgi:hypothetical protein
MAIRTMQYENFPFRQEGNDDGLVHWASLIQVPHWEALCDAALDAWRRGAQKEPCEASVNCLCCLAMEAEWLLEVSTEND